MYYFFIPLSFIIAGCLARLIIPSIIRAAFKKRLFDVPDERKLHTSAIPRLGGFSFVPIILFTLAFVCALVCQYDTEVVGQKILSVFPETMFFICGLVVLYLIGILDDMVGARYRVKFSAQILASVCIPLSGIWIDSLYGLFGIYAIAPWIGIPLTMFIIVLVINSINLIDGIDGLASGLSCISLIIMGVILIMQQSWVFALLAFTTLGMLFPFFYYNVFGQTAKRSKIFMGDTGSLVLGYIQVFLAIQILASPPSFDYNMLVVTFSVLFIPVFDVFRVIVVRIGNRKHIFEADRNHIHHKFLKMGLGPQESLVILLAAHALLCSINILLATFDVNVTILVFANIFVWLLFNAGIDYITYHREKKASMGLNLQGDGCKG
jgi:UDP-N-acetylmuramyl pentapeptide phosphotransferase/UDP-N-acetylglucosamine-1-phosphate transferase